MHHYWFFDKELSCLIMQPFEFQIWLSPWLSKSTWENLFFFISSNQFRRQQTRPAAAATTADSIYSPGWITLHYNNIPCVLLHQEQLRKKVKVRGGVRRNAGGWSMHRQHKMLCKGICCWLSHDETVYVYAHADIVQVGWFSGWNFSLSLWV